MSENSVLEILEKRFEGVLNRELIVQFSEIGKLVDLQNGDILVDTGDLITAVPLLLDGAIKVMREDPDGRELLLYYLESGDTCAMSMDCCLKGSTSSIRAVSEGVSKVVLIPSGGMEEMMSLHPDWRNFIIQNYHQRLEEMLEAIDSLAFNDMASRIQKYLKDRSYVLGTSDLDITHAEIALDLNSSRVVVSRLIKRLEERGLIDQKRNRIHLHLNKWNH